MIAHKSCLNCSNYHGRTYNGVFLNCAIVPLGIDEVDQCEDFKPDHNSFRDAEDLVLIGDSLSDFISQRFLEQCLASGRKYGSGRKFEIRVQISHPSISKPLLCDGGKIRHIPKRRV
jgi:hypothetical protein